MISCTPNISLGCEFYQATYYLNQDLMDGPFPIVAGQVVVPDCPGLGMGVDMQVLEKHTVAASGNG